MASLSYKIAALVVGLAAASSGLSGLVYAMGGGGGGGGDGGGKNAADDVTKPAPAATGSSNLPVAQPAADAKKTVTPGTSGPSN